MENKIKHLEFIQNVITRMNTNSFQLKGWMLTIVSALLALYANSDNVTYIFVAIAPVLIFGALDAYYLQQERKFRGMYDDVVANKVELFAMPLNNYKYVKGDNKSKKYCYCSVFFSKTIILLYGTITILLIVGGLLMQ